MPTEHKDATSVWQVLKFTLFSISAGLIQIAAFTLMETVFHLPYWPSYLTALVLSVLWNFTFNRRYTFRSDASVARSMLLVALFYLPVYQCTELGYFDTAKHTSGVGEGAAPKDPGSFDSGWGGF